MALAEVWSQSAASLSRREDALPVGIRDNDIFSPSECVSLSQLRHVMRMRNSCVNLDALGRIPEESRARPLGILQSNPILKRVRDRLRQTSFF